MLKSTPPASTSSISSNQSSSGKSGVGGPTTGAIPARSDDGATIVSKRIGSNRPPRTPTDPRTRQDSVREALRAVTEDWQGAGTASGSSSSRSGILPDPNAVPAELLGSGSSASKQQQWWQRRFEVLYLPTLGYQDGAVGFVQADVSLQPGARDVRVLTFEDRHDCMHCLAVMREWPDTAGCLLTMGAMQTATLERDIRNIWLEQWNQAQQRQWSDSRAMAGPEAPGPSAPSGVVVFRRGKLPLRTGMSQEEFMQLVVYQAAAQTALGKIGYGFED